MEVAVRLGVRVPTVWWLRAQDEMLGEQSAWCEAAERGTVWLLENGGPLRKKVGTYGVKLPNISVM